MSEPVGNGPRMSDIKPNTLSAKQVPDSPDKNRAEKVIVGKVITKKPSLFRRATKSIVAEDAGTVGDFILIEVVIPAVKNLIRDIVVGGIDRTLYSSGGVPSGRGGIVSGSSIRSKYHNVPQQERPRVLSPSNRSTHDFTDVILPTRDDALRVIQGLVERIEEYGVATVVDYYDFLGQSSNPTDLNWGWRDLRDVDIRQVREGFVIVLPRTTLLR